MTEHVSIDIEGSSLLGLLYSNSLKVVVALDRVQDISLDDGSERERDNYFKIDVERSQIETLDTPCRKSFFCSRRPFRLRIFWSILFWSRRLRKASMSSLNRWR